MLNARPNGIGNLEGRYYRLLATLSRGSTKETVERIVTFVELRHDALEIIGVTASGTKGAFSKDIHYPLLFFLLLSLEVKDEKLFAPGVTGMTLQCLAQEHLFVSNIIPTLLKVSIDYSVSKKVYGDLLRVEPNQKIKFCTTFPFAAKWIAKVISEREVHKKIERAAARASIRIIRLNRVRDAKKEKETDNKLFFLRDPSGEVGLPPSPIRNPKFRKRKDADESLRMVLELCDLEIIEPSSDEPESVYILDQDWLVKNNHPMADPDWIPENGDRLPLEALVFLFLQSFASQIT
ncbi:hypothetical protein BT69DRAFT_86782 [Atractiella rhizophila]|nr:hypothetical protein BT69DRAFT_86782 [Atractiella rhizophila]